MKVRIDFFRTGGKWYAGGEIETDLQIWHEDFKQELVNKQKIMREGWQGRYFVVTSDTSQNDLDASYRGFYMHHWMPWDFIGYKKQIS